EGMRSRDGDDVGFCRSQQVVDGGEEPRGCERGESLLGGRVDVADSDQFETLHRRDRAQVLSGDVGAGANQADLQGCRTVQITHQPIFPLRLREVTPGPVATTRSPERTLGVASY